MEKMPKKDRGILKTTAAMRELEKRIAAMPGVRKVDGVRYSNGAIVYFIDPKSFDSLRASFLYVLGHCIDRRYWKHGPDWRLSVLTDDTHNFPSYVLESQPGAGSVRQVASLVKSIDEEVSVPLFADDPDLKRLADRWRRNGWRSKPRKRTAPKLATVAGARRRQDVKSRSRPLRKSDPA
jgi:hypothetical protein